MGPPTDVLTHFCPTSISFKIYEGGEINRKWQLPQLLAGALIRTKLCFLQWTNMTGAEQRSFFFYCSGQNIKWVQVLQECLQGWGQSNAVFFSPSTVHVRLHMCVYLFMHVVPFRPDWRFASFGCAVEEHIQSYVSKQLLYGGKLEQIQVTVFFRRGWGLSRTRCKGHGGSWVWLKETQ